MLLLVALFYILFTIIYVSRLLTTSNNMENVLQDINRRFISLPDAEVRRNNIILESVLNTFINKMRTKDILFDAMFRRVFYGGSYYDGLRVGRPEEFDLDLLLHVPKYSEPVVVESNIPGFVHLQVKKFDAWMRQPEATPAYKNFGKLFDEKFYLSTFKALAWMEGIVQKSLNDLRYNNGGGYILEDDMGSFVISFSKGGPAMTLHISGAGIKMDVDLVTCFVFGGDKWPVNGFRSNPFPNTKPEFFLVPKRPSTNENQPTHRYWRLSFQEQERALLDNKRALKPTIKLLKKMRDNLGQYSIASYYIKTVLLHIIAQKEETFWSKPLNQVFMFVLKEYKDFIKNGNIPYYWNRKNNLIGKVSGETLQNFSGRLTAVIKDIENNYDKPKTVAKYLLTRDEYMIFMGNNEAGGFTSYDQQEFGVPANNNQQSNCAIL